MQINIKVEGIKEALEKFSSKVIEKAAISTLNEVIKSTRTLASNLIRNERGWKIKKGDFDRRVKMTLARRGDLKAVLTASRISASGKFTGKDSFALPYFGATEQRSIKGKTYRISRKVAKIQKRPRAGAGGVTVQVLRGGTVARYPSAFMATMKSGHIGVFRRVEGKASTGRQKIREVKTITLATMFQGTFPKLRDHALQKFKERFPGKLEWAKR